MKIWQLIEELQQYNQEAEVYIVYETYATAPIKKVYPQENVIELKDSTVAFIEAYDK